MIAITKAFDDHLYVTFDEFCQSSLVSGRCSSVEDAKALWQKMLADPNSITIMYQGQNLLQVSDGE